MKRIKIVDNKELFSAGEAIRKFKFAFAGTPDKNLKAYRAAKKTVAQTLTSISMSTKK